MSSPLITPDALSRLDADDLVVLDARPAAAYAEGHLPGAVHADLEAHLSSASESPDAARGGRHPLPPLERWLDQVAAWGIGPSTTVVVYDDQSGANAASRAWWMLRAIGHDDVRVLDGDWREVESVPQTHAPKPDSTRRRVDRWLLPTSSMSDVDQLRADPKWRVLDVRSRERFRGETEPIDPVAGHIPGAINLPYFDNLEQARFKSPDELRRLYETFLDGAPPERVVVHCGSGVTACHTLLALEAAGLPGASLYVGSWGEWCRNDMPVGRGE